MQEIDRVKEEIFKILFPFADVKRVGDIDLIDSILALKIDGTTLKELLEKLDETEGDLVIVNGSKTCFNCGREIPKKTLVVCDCGVNLMARARDVIWQGGQE